MAAPAPAGGWWTVLSSGRVVAHGPAHYYGSPKAVRGRVVGIVPTPSGKGYYLFTRSGAVYAFGNARAHGSLRGRTRGPVVGLGPLADGRGYYLVTASGAVYGLGAVVGHEQGAALAGVVGVAADPAGGYWVVTRTGGARSSGTMGLQAHPHLGSPVVAVLGGTRTGPVVLLADGREVHLVARAPAGAHHRRSPPRRSNRGGRTA